MRLIDADELLKQVERSLSANPHKDGEIAKNHIYEHQHFMHLISCAPTAFDLVIAMGMISAEIEKIKSYLDGGKEETPCSPT